MSEKAWLDASVFRCPRCGRWYVDASWYVVELESDIECGKCHETFNPLKQATDRIMLEFKIDAEGKVLRARATQQQSKEGKNANRKKQTEQQFR